MTGSISGSGAGRRVGTGRRTALAAAALSCLLAAAGCTSGSGGFGAGQLRDRSAPAPGAATPSDGRVVVRPSRTGPAPSVPPAAAGWRFDALGALKKPSILAGVAAVDQTHAWAVGYEESTVVGSSAGVSPIIERWDGATWTRVQIGGLVRPETAPLRLVAADGPADVWAVGGTAQAPDQVTTRIFHDDGAGWREVAFPLTPKLAELQVNGLAVSAGHVFLAGRRSGNAPVFAEWDGQWHERPAPPECSGGGPSFGGMPNFCDVNGVTAFAPDDVWAAGNGAWSGFAGPLLFHWDGTAWHTVRVLSSPQSRQFLMQVTGRSSTDMWAVGAFAGQSESPVVHGDGTVFTEVPWTMVGQVDGLVVDRWGTPWVLGVTAVLGTSHVMRGGGVAAGYWSRFEPPPAGDDFDQISGIVAVPGTTTLLAVGSAWPGQGTTAANEPVVLRFDAVGPPSAPSASASATADAAGTPSPTPSPSATATATP